MDKNTLFLLILNICRYYIFNYLIQDKWLKRFIDVITLHCIEVVRSLLADSSLIFSPSLGLFSEWYPETGPPCCWQCLTRRAGWARRRTRSPALAATGRQSRQIRTSHRNLLVSHRRSVKLNVRLLFSSVSSSPCLLSGLWGLVWSVRGRPWWVCWCGMSCGLLWKGFKNSSSID